MKKIVFSFILLFGAVLFVPQSSFAQVLIKSQQNKKNKKVVVKKHNRHKGVTVKTQPSRHTTRVMDVKPNQPNVIVKRP